MSESLLLAMTKYFIDTNMATGDGVDIFRDFTPEQPDNLVALHEYAGEAALAYEPAVHRSVQVIVRDVDAESARLRAQMLFKTLIRANNIVNFTTNRWGQVFLRQPPFRLKTDEKDRVIYGFNIGITTTIE